MLGPPRYFSYYPFAGSERFARRSDLYNRIIFVHIGAMSAANKIVRHGIEAEKSAQLEFFKLAQRFRNATDPKEAKRIGDQLGRMVLGS